VSTLKRGQPLGLTLAELAVAIALLGIVAAGIHRIVVSGQRVYRVQAERMDLQQTLRVAAHLLPAELRELDATDGDILGMGSDSIRFRAMRQLAFLCAGASLAPSIPATRVVTATLTIARDPRFGLRDGDPATDSLLVYDPGADAWLVGSIISAKDASCGPPDRVPPPRAARLVQARLTLRPGSGDGTSTLPEGSPVRWFEPVTYLLYQASDGRHYIGQRSGGDLQPVIGPLTPRGFELRYFDAAGDVTPDPRRVAAIEIRVRGRSTQPVRASTGGLTRLTDSLVTRVALRGTPQP
jgi:hypothetical protein